MTNFIIDDNGNEISFDDIGSLVGFEYPEISVISTDIPGKSGVFYVKSDYGKRRLSWRGVFRAIGPTNRRTILALTIGALKTLKFTTCDSLSLQADIAITKILMPYRRDRSTYLIEAFAPDYRFFDQTLTNQDTAPTVSVGGITLPTVLPIDFSNVVGVPKLTLTNSGDEPTPPTFTITGPGTNFTIQNTTNGEILQINTTITSVDTITIDVLNKTILLNDQVNIFGTKSGDFWNIPAGVSELNFTVQTGSDSSTMLNVQYRSAYKGI